MSISFDDCFSENSIISYLSRQRAKHANKKNKENILATISKQSKRNIKKGYIYKIMPPRRLWVRISKERRYRNGFLINSIDRNREAIFLTIKKHKRFSINHIYLYELNKFLGIINQDINNKNFNFHSPNIRPEPKEKGSSKCRPISNFKLRDNLINCLTNKYLVNYLDNKFYKYSFAFRAKRIINGETKVPNHHDAFQVIIDYLKKKF